MSDDDAETIARKMEAGRRDGWGVPSADPRPCPGERTCRHGVIDADGSCMICCTKPIHCEGCPGCVVAPRPDGKSWALKLIAEMGAQAHLEGCSIFSYSSDRRLHDTDHCDCGLAAVVTDAGGVVAPRGLSAEEREAYEAWKSAFRYGETWNGHQVIADIIDKYFPASEEGAR